MQNQPHVFAKRKWWILGAVLSGSMVGTLGNSLTPVALPAMMNHFHIGIDVGVWIVTIYIVLFSTLMPLFGKLGDMFGYKRIYLAAMIGGALFNSLCALAPSVGWLIAFRVLAGIANAPTLPAIMAIIAEVFPSEQRGAALGFWALTNGSGHSLGPVISGFLVQYLGWPSIFWFNGALTAIGAVMILFIIPSDHRRASERFDFVGAFTLTATMILLMFNISQSLNRQFPPWLTSALWVGLIVLFVTFLITQTRVRTPFVDLRLFRNAGYAITTFVSAAQLFCWFGLNVLLPLFFINVQAHTPSQTGLLMLWLAVSLAVLSPLAGRVSDRVGSRVTCLIGMSIVALGGLWLSTWSALTPAWLAAGTLAILGCGMGLIQSPSANAVTLVVGQTSLGVALGIFNMLRFMSGSLGQTIFGAVLDWHGGPAAGVGAYRLDFYILAGVAAVAALLALKMPSAARALAARRIEAGASVAGD
jgi:EmrB/QacA subfamily drug resistance transporter